MIAVDIDKINYDDALLLQERMHKAIVEERIDDVILLLEHDPVITFGKSGKANDLLVSEEELARRGIPVRRVNRGGKLTCHYPGQLVCYVIMRMALCGGDIGKLMAKLEQIILDVLKEYAVKAEIIRGMTGVWVDNKKIAAIGVEVRKDVTMHGFALNISKSGEGLYNLFIPCGISDKGVTFLENHIPENGLPDIQIFKKKILNKFSEIFNVPKIPVFGRKDLKGLLGTAEHDESKA